MKPWLEQGLKVVVCEPSCASALNDDLPDLIEDPNLSQLLKDGVLIIDDFVAGELRAGNQALLTKENLAIHGHCHQKALYGTDSLLNIYETTGKPCQEIPSGCCGMAGSFGYEKEHYQISKKIGEETLFPDISKLKDSHTIVANGFSCRHQIEHFTGVKAKHWVETVSLRK